MLSAVIITKNEENQIVDCIASLVDVVDEVLVVDAFSTDKTCEKAQSISAKVRIHSKAWEGYGAARNYGADQAQNEWILSIDADERCDKKLARNIIALRQKPSSLNGDNVFAMRRINIYRGVQMKYGMLAPEIKPRIYTKHHYIWDDSYVHERLRAQASHDLVRSHFLLEGELLHYTYDDVDVHRSKLSKYAHLAARQWLRQGRRTSIIEAMIAPSYHFLRNFLWKGGILDRKYGWETSRTASLYHAEKYKQYDALKD